MLGLKYVCRIGQLSCLSRRATLLPCSMHHLPTPGPLQAPDAVQAEQARLQRQLLMTQIVGFLAMLRATGAAATGAPALSSVGDQQLLRKVVSAQSVASSSRPSTAMSHSSNSTTHSAGLSLPARPPTASAALGPSASGFFARSRRPHSSPTRPSAVAEWTRPASASLYSQRPGTAASVAAGPTSLSGITGRAADLKAALDEEAEQLQDAIDELQAEMPLKGAALARVQAAAAEESELPVSSLQRLRRELQEHALAADAHDAEAGAAGIARPEEAGATTPPRGARQARPSRIRARLTQRLHDAELLAGTGTEQALDGAAADAGSASSDTDDEPFLRQDTWHRPSSSAQNAAPAASSLASGLLADAESIFD